jgi:DNA-binding beta-propeller fold protein YncE
MNIRYILIFLLILTLTNSCKKDPPIIDISKTGYPKEIGELIIKNCAVSGCHNDISKNAAGGLSLSTWDKLFEGTRNGSVVIPYKHSLSTLFLFTNTYNELGVSNLPTMPINGKPLSKEQVKMIRDWINKGAPNNKGEIKFADNPNRKKYYVTNQGCDLVYVFDSETDLAMRVVEVGNNTAIESPHMVKVSPDGKHWYVCFTNGNSFQKFRTSDNRLVGEVNISLGNWNTFVITKDSKNAFVVDWSFEGRIAWVDLEKMELKKIYQGSGLLKWPHGSALSPDEKFLYVTSQTGNYIYKIDIRNPNFPDFEEISLVPGQPPSNLSSIDPHEIVFSPDGTKYFVSCQKSNEVRVFQSNNDSLIAIIETGEYPQEFSFSLTTDYLFVSCTEDRTSFPGKVGSVSIINYKTNTLVKKIHTGTQPHGIAVDDNKKLVYVAHRNIDSSGPAPHHTTECGGRNGYLTAIDLTTLELKPNFRPEVSSDPYSISIKK